MAKKASRGRSKRTAKSFMPSKTVIGVLLRIILLVGVVYELGGFDKVGNALRFGNRGRSKSSFSYKVPVSAVKSTAPTTGPISVSSNVQGVSVFVDGVSKTSPITGVAPGSHVVKVTNSGYVDFSQTVTVTAGQTATVTATLVPATGSLNVYSNQPESDVYTGIQGQSEGFRGKRRIDTSKPLIMSGLVPGMYRAQVQKTGYVPFTSNYVVVNVSTTGSISATLTLFQNTSVKK